MTENTALLNIFPAILYVEVQQHRSLQWSVFRWLNDEGKSTVADNLLVYDDHKVINDIMKFKKH